MSDEEFLAESNKWPMPQLAAMRWVFEGNAATKPAHDNAKKFLKDSPKAFMELLGTLEKAYQAQLAASHRAGASKAIVPAGIQAAGPLVEEPDEGEMLIQDLLERVKRRVADGD